MIKFKSILADPPWFFNDKLDPSREKPYKTLTMENLKNLPVKDVSCEEAHLYLWCPTTLIKFGIETLEAWGFDYKTFIVWQKITKHGKKHFGMGRYFRNTFEICLFGTRKNLKLKTKNTRNSFDAKKPARHHSSKPDEFYEIVELNSYEPYLELFATQKRKNWLSLGDEINGKDIRNTLQKLYRDIVISAKNNFK